MPKFLHSPVMPEGVETFHLARVFSAGEALEQWRGILFLMTSRLLRLLVPSKDNGGSLSRSSNHAVAKTRL